MQKKMNKAVYKWFRMSGGMLYRLDSAAPEDVDSEEVRAAVVDNTAVQGERRELNPADSVFSPPSKKRSSESAMDENTNSNKKQALPVEQALKLDIGVKPKRYENCVPETQSDWDAEVNKRIDKQGYACIFVRRSKSAVFRLDKNLVVKVIVNESSWKREVAAGMPMDKVRKFKIRNNIATAGSLGDLDDTQMVKIAQFIERPFGYAIVTPYAGEELMRWIQYGGHSAEDKMAASRAVAQKILEMWLQGTGEFRGGCHSDLKLENILIRQEEGSGFQVTIIDWEYYDNAASEDKKFHGTFQYMHPWVTHLSQNKGQPINREQRQLSDIYACLMVLYAIKHGEFQAKDALIDEMGGMAMAMHQTSEAVKRGLTLVKKAASGDSPPSGEQPSGEQEPYTIKQKLGNQVELRRDVRRDGWTTVEGEHVQEVLSVACKGSIDSLNVDDQVTVTSTGLAMELRKGSFTRSCEHVTPAWNEPITRPLLPPPIKRDREEKKRKFQEANRPKRLEQIWDAINHWTKNPRVSKKGVRKPD